VDSSRQLHPDPLSRATYTVTGGITSIGELQRFSVGHWAGNHAAGEIRRWARQEKFVPRNCLWRMMAALPFIGY
jgi:hypothetical protein